MTDTDNDKQVEAEVHLEPLTVRQLIESLSTFPQDTMVVAGIEGVGYTIALTGAMVVTSEEGINLTILMLDKGGTERAMAYAAVDAKDAN